MRIALRVRRSMSASIECIDLWQLSMTVAQAQDKSREMLGAKRRTQCCYALEVHRTWRAVSSRCGITVVAEL